MATRRAQDITPSKVSPPGYLLAEELVERGMNHQDLADLIGISAKHLSQIITGKAPITPETALKLETVLEGPSAHYWLNLENRYRLWVEAGSPGVRLTEMKARLCTYLPLVQLQRHGWLAKAKDPQQLLQLVLSFLGLDSLEQFDAQLGQANYKHTPSEKVNGHYKHAWYLAAQQLCQQLPQRSYDRDALLQLAALMHGYTQEPEKIADFLTRLQNEAGVTVRIFPHFEKTRIDGAAFWLRPGQPAVVLTNRYDKLDKLWFDLAHELAHVALHLPQQQQGFLDVDGEEKDLREHEANQQAAQWLNTHGLAALLPQKSVRPQNKTLQALAQQRGIHPALVVGALQHSKAIDHKTGNLLRTDIAKHIPKNFILHPNNNAHAKPHSPNTHP